MNDTTVLKGRQKILVLGATGGTGLRVVTQALARGHTVTALVRSPGKAGAYKGVNLLSGDARDEKSLRQAVKGQDAVISALGTPPSPFSEVTLLSTATRALVSAMKAEQASRVHHRHWCGRQRCLLRGAK